MGHSALAATLKRRVGIFGQWGPCQGAANFVDTHSHPFATTSLAATFQFARLDYLQFWGKQNETRVENILRQPNEPRYPVSWLPFRICVCFGVCFSVDDVRQCCHLDLHLVAT